MNAPPVEPKVLIPDDEVFIRMTAVERWQHGLLAASFVVLILTGLPVLAGEAGFIRLFAGRALAYTLRGLLHRMAAIVLIAAFVWHLAYTVFTARGRQNFRDKLPMRRDLKDAWSVFRPRAPRPQFDRYGYVEKFEYWSLLWGSSVMILTGFFMWATSLSLRLFPLWLHQVFVVIHGYEAILAFAAILIWHMYTVHLNPEVFPMSRVWLDGRITGAEMRRRHPLQYRRLLESRERLYRELLALESGAEGGGGQAGPAPAVPRET
jgi:cytochrome b subunit of formate dehydrogenase